ncbi:hypothetical protein K469DRAFT_738499 [Zopfia rhizophila CBS 207.26]|uniref:Cora-domain-containing protein n=1 Tax=Zopfia rhizophila CBS 207.26 TaxID=1314779 RepID=A0A6A6E4B3_9PEZI|nr:hypothetical protein K469DRAFT_738499 [Zopfia rhizophila CBS 207.26]
MSVEELKKQLEALQRSHDALVRSITLSNGAFGPSDASNLQRSGLDKLRDSDLPNVGFADTSTLSDDSDDEDESYFVQEELPYQSFDHEHLREHLKKYEWDEYGRQILSTVVTDRGRLKDPHLFPTHRGPAEDRSHYSHYQVYDIGPEGAAVLVETSGKENNMSKAMEIWHSIKDINADSAKSQKAVGRITIAREPSPILFGALHLTMHKTFDMDELFRHLVEAEGASAHMNRAFHQDIRHQKTFFFNFEYYTIIGDDCKPMQWQRADRDKSSTKIHVPLSRCSAVVALALYDPKPRRIKNRARRARTRYGWVQDLWSPWQVLNIQCNPDWRATTDTFESGHRYMNGPEAFLHALLTEYKDAIVRYEEIYKKITKLITPPLDFIFNDGLRDERLFEDARFTWTRRYFWAHQTLGNVNDSIRVMVDAFEDTFTDDVWEGKSKTLWPLFEESPRNEFWKRRLRALRLQFEHEMKELRMLIRQNNERRREIDGLQNQLFSGTSVLESRKSVELSDITVHQGHNIKLLTLVNIFFLPLTFVTSVYGMTNMSTEPHFWKFGLTLAMVCIPFFVLVGFLNTDSGYRLMLEKTRALYHWLKPKKKVKKEEDSFKPEPVERTLSTEEGMHFRLGQSEPKISPKNSSPEKREPNIEVIGEGKQTEVSDVSSKSKEGEMEREGGQAAVVNGGVGGNDAVIEIKNQ